MSILKKKPPAPPTAEAAGVGEEKFSQAKQTFLFHYFHRPANDSLTAFMFTLRARLSATERHCF